MKIEEPRRFGILGEVFLEGRLQERWHTHFKVALVRTGLSGLLSFVVEDAIYILVFLRIENVNGIQSTHTEGNQRDILSDLHQRIGETASVWNDIEELTQHTCRDSSFLRYIAFGDDNISPWILQFDYSLLFVIELPHRGLIDLTHTNGVLFLAAVGRSQILYPSVKKSRSQAREHNVVSLSKAFHVLDCPFVVARGAFLTSCNHLFYMLSRII